MTELKTKILHTLSKENIKMIPRWKFMLYSSLGIIGIIFAFLLAVFAGSLFLFVLSKYGFMYMSFFDLIATARALNLIPILLLVMTVFLLVVIEMISRNYTFSFRKPLAVTLLVLTSLTVVISFVLSQTGMHQYIRDYARSHHMDMMSRAYDRPRPFKGENGMTVIRGEVVKTSTTTATVKLFDGSILTVYASTTANGFSKPEVGSDIVIFGRFLGERFQIMSIQLIEPGSPLPSLPVEQNQRIRVLGGDSKMSHHIIEEKSSVKVK
jgi:hypothetical protein